MLLGISRQISRSSEVLTYCVACAAAILAAHAAAHARLFASASRRPSLLTI